MVELYFVFSMWFAGDAQPDVKYYGPISQLECNYLAEQAQRYAAELQATVETQLYLLSACVPEEELRRNSI